jgi:hypothetical protein
MATSTSVQTFMLTRLATTTGTVDLVVAGTKYDKQVGTPFVRFKLMPRESTINSVGAAFVQEIGGLAQIDCFYPGLRGTTDAEAMAQAIVTSFLPAVHLDSGDQIVFENVWTEGIREDGPTWLQVPVFVRWRAFRQ